MTPVDLGAWVARESARYPDAEAEDRLLAPFRGAEFFTRAQVEQLVDRKFADAPRRAQRVREQLASEPDERIEDLTRQALACFHDLVALLACQALGGIAPATASLLLAAQDPDRFVVIDRRAVTSLQTLGYLPDAAHFDPAQDWEPYLRAARRLAADAGHDLPTTARALLATGD